MPLLLLLPLSEPLRSIFRGFSCGFNSPGGFRVYLAACAFFLFFELDIIGLFGNYAVKYFSDKLFKILRASRRNTQNAAPLLRVEGQQLTDIVRICLVDVALFALCIKHRVNYHL